MDSGNQVGAMRLSKRPKTLQLGAQDGPVTAQETPKTAQEPPKGCKNSFQEAAQRCLRARFCPRAAQELPKGRPAPFQTSFLDRFADNFGSFLRFFPSKAPLLRGMHLKVSEGFQDDVPLASLRP